MLREISIEKMRSGGVLNDKLTFARLTPEEGYQERQ
jgi:hypothetical protein